MFMVIGCFDFYPTFRFITHNKGKKRYICALDHSSNARGRFKDNCSCSTPRRKETSQLMVDQAGVQRDPRVRKRLHTNHVQVNSSSLGLAVVAGIESTSGGEKNARVFYQLLVASGSLL